MDILNTLSIVSVIWIIAAGILIFFLLFLFAKRQLMRFTLKSRRGPYFAIGANAPKSLRTEISRRLDKVPDIRYEPKLLNPSMEQFAKSGQNHFYYRMLAMDSFSKFDDCLRAEVPAACRHPKQTVREYLISIYPVYLSTAPIDLVNHFIQLYEHARHRPEVFCEQHYELYAKDLDRLVECLQEGIALNKEANIEELKHLPPVETDHSVKSHHKGLGKSRSSRSSIPYNHMVSDKSSSRLQTRYRTRANSSEQAGLLESGPSSQRSSVEGLIVTPDSSDEIVRLMEVNMNTMPDI